MSVDSSKENSKFRIEKVNGSSFTNKWPSFFDGIELTISSSLLQQKKESFLTQFYSKFNCSWNKNISICSTNNSYTGSQTQFILHHHDRHGKFQGEWEAIWSVPLPPWHAAQLSVGSNGFWSIEVQFERRHCCWVGQRSLPVDFGLSGRWRARHSSKDSHEGSILGGSCLLWNQEYWWKQNLPWLFLCFPIQRTGQTKH